MTLRVLAAARAEIAEAVEWYNERSPGVGNQFLAAIVAATKAIQAKPEVWPFFCRPYRKCPVRRFPYNVVYEIDGDDIFVIAVAHHRRRPGYWAGRRR